MKHPIIVTLITAFAALATIDASQGASSEQAVVVLFGDSTTVGFIPDGFPGATGQSIRVGNGTTTRGVPTLHLSDILNNGSVRRPSVVANWGWGGTSTALGDGNGVGRVSSNLLSAASTHTGSQYFVLILYGSNDLRFGIDANTTGFNVGQMIDIARQRGFVPVVGTILPRSDYNMTPYNNQIKAVAQQKGAHLVDLYAVLASTPGGFSALYTSEYDARTNSTINLHPKIEGYELVAETWLRQHLSGAIKGRGLIPIGAITLLLDDDPAPPPPPAAAPAQAENDSE